MQNVTMIIRGNASPWVKARQLSAAGILSVKIKNSPTHRYFSQTLVFERRREAFGGVSVVTHEIINDRARRLLAIHESHRLANIIGR